MNTNLLPRQLVIGVDFDNTLASYDNVVHSAAVDLGLISPETIKNKFDVRTAIRALPGGEIEWQKLQGLVYGPRMGEATLTEGAAAFFKRGNGKGVKFYVISHKTELANYDETQTNLRQSALHWMFANGFFEPDGLNLSRKDVFFEETRADKLKRIEQIGCTHFIDDLEEVLTERCFPSGVSKILYTASPPRICPPDVATATTWAQISNLVFGDQSSHAD